MNMVTITFYIEEADYESIKKLRDSGQRDEYGRVISAAGHIRKAIKKYVKEQAK